MFRGIVSKGDYLRSILHRDWETDSKGRVVCRFTTNRPVVDTIFFVNIIVMKIQFPGGMMKQGNISSIRKSEIPKEHCVSITVHCKVRMIGGRLYSRMSISTVRMKFWFAERVRCGIPCIITKFINLSVQTVVSCWIIRLLTGFIAIVAVGMRCLRKRIRLRGIVPIIKCRYSGFRRSIQSGITNPWRKWWLFDELRRFFPAEPCISTGYYR